MLLDGGERSLLAGLERLIIDDAAFRELHALIKPYCPFEAMGVVGAEIRHGNFLAYMLDPFRPHGYGSAVLREFLSAAVSNPARLSVELPLTRLEVHLADLGDAEVRREWRSIDLLLIVHELRSVVAIELKIDSLQHGNQLRRYRASVEAHWPRSDKWKHMFVFLTKNNEAPEDADHWLPVRLADLIVPFEKLSEEPSTAPLAAQMLGAYARMMKRRHLNDEKINEIVRKLWSTHGEVLAFLADRRPDQVGEIFELIREESPGVLAGLGGEWEEDSDVGNIIRYAYKPWDDIPGFRSAVGWSESGRLVLFELKRSGDGIYGLIYVGPGKEPVRSRLATALASAKKRGRRTPGDKWAQIDQRELVRMARDMASDPAEVAKAAKLSFASFAREIAAELDPIVRGALVDSAIKDAGIDSLSTSVES